LNAQFPNPFQGLGPSGNARTDNRTISRLDLLRAYPQFANVKTRRYDGTNDYGAAQLRLSKRFNRGYTLGMAYTYSKFREQVSALNATTGQLESRLSLIDMPHRVAANGILELPFGRNRRWGRSWPSPVETIAGGWQLGFVYEYQTGRPFDLGGSNLAYFGDPAKLVSVINSGTIDGAFHTSGFDFHDAAAQTNGVDDPVKQRADRRISLADNLRTFPSRIDGLREENTNNWNVSVLKSARINRTTVQLRAEVLNAFNRPQFGNPGLKPANADFGRITSQSLNFPRQIQLGAKISF